MLEEELQEMEEKIESYIVHTPYSYVESGLSV